LHATDLSDLSNNAFHAAHALARAHGARLLLLYVKQPQETIEAEFGTLPPEPEPSDEEIRQQLDAMVPDDSPVEAEAMVAHGAPVPTIVQAARDTRSDLIVMGSHGRKGLARLLHANVADHVTRAAPCPVLALRTSQTEAHGSSEAAKTAGEVTGA
jgi:nucleotide-binding universal stress UspA family protein